jgi:hypothetical protein
MEKQNKQIGHGNINGIVDPRQPLQLNSHTILKNSYISWAPFAQVTL